MEWFEQNGWLAWLGLALALGAVEAATADFIFLMLAGGALAGAVAAGVGTAFSVQVVVAVIVAMLLLGVVRPRMKARFMPREQAIGTTAYVGREAVVVDTVTQGSGSVKLGGEVWSARLGAEVSPVQPGRTVTVSAIDGATAVVVPVDTGHGGVVSGNEGN